MIAKLVPVAVLTTLVLGSCGLVEPAAAVVGGKKIPMSEVTEAVEDFRRSPEFERLGQQGDAEAITREFEQSYLATLIRRAVLTPEAAERGIEVTEEEVVAQLDEIKAEFASDSAFNEALKEQGLTLSQLEQLISDRALEQKLREDVTADLAPDDAEVQAFYDDNIERFSESEVQHILVDARDLAEKIARQLDSAGKAQRAALFARLAKKYSTDKSNSNDAGKLGFFSQGDFVPEFERATNELEVGDISGPVKTEFGFHIIWVTDRRQKPLDEVRDQIVAEITGAGADTAWQRWVIAAYRDADVEVNPRFGEFNLETQQIEDASTRTVPGAEETPAVSPEPTQAG